jgi:hypothetical protein
LGVAEHRDIQQEVWPEHLGPYFFASGSKLPGKNFLLGIVAGFSSRQGESNIGTAERKIIKINLTVGMEGTQFLKWGQAKNTWVVRSRTGRWQRGTGSTG